MRSRERKIQGYLRTLEGFLRDHTLGKWYTAIFLCVMGLAVGVLALGVSAYSCPALASDITLESYFGSRFLLAMNLLPPLLLIYLGYFLFQRAWAAYLFTAIPTLGIAVVNYYKIKLRSEPFYPSDFALARSANGVLKHYSIGITGTILVTAVCFAVGLLTSILLCRKKGGLKKRWRAAGALLCVLAALALYKTYTDEALWSAERYIGTYNIYDQPQLCIVHGSVYSFLYYIPDALQTAPEGFDKNAAREKLSEYEDSDIPQDRKVNVIGVMLEAFSDLSDFPTVAAIPGVQEMYEPLHELEANSVHGNLLTDIFAGGTAVTEWQSLTGANFQPVSSSKIQSDMDSYVWYLREQGYETTYTHPYFNFMYNRKNIIPRLGFETARFYEDTFQDKIRKEYTYYYSDVVLFDLLRDEAFSHEVRQGQAPEFSFAVSMQNHGGYGGTSLLREEVFPEKGSGLSTESWMILNNYLAGVQDTIIRVVNFINDMETCDEPYVIYLFGDHKPWLGDANSVYQELGVSLDTSTLEGYYNYYSTPYLIWANSAAKEMLDNDFHGEGGDLSPCFLMMKLFDLCGWEGPGFMKLTHELYNVTPLAGRQGAFLVDGVLTKELPPNVERMYQDYVFAQYYRRVYGLNE